MSLSKQLLLLMSMLFVLIFAGNLAIGVKQIRDYLQTEALIHAQDTATSLGLSLSPHMADPTDPILETMIRAIYDMGYYREIRLRDVEGQTLAVANDTRVFPEVPPWLMRVLPMETAIANSEINRGWQRAGVVEVSIHPGYAYLNLYRLMRQALWYSLAALLISMLLLFLVLRLTLRPLHAIQRLAVTIAAGRFARIDPLPWTTEVRQVAKAMNLMSGQVEAVLAHLNAKLEALGERLQRDSVTGLFGEARLESDLEHWLTDGRGGALY